MFFLLHQNYCWSQSAPLFSVGNDGEVDKGVCQVGHPNGVKSLMRRSPTTTPNGVKTTKKPDGTQLILQPSGLLTIITSGEIITVLSVTGSVATIAQLILMIIDMKSRKSNENKLSKLHPKASEKLDEIKEIAVLMSDSTRPSFKSWQHDPHEVKKFVEMFQSTPTAQKPLRVIFTLKNGSKIVIKVDENTADQQKLLDEFIEHLKN